MQVNHKAGKGEVVKMTKGELKKLRDAIAICHMLVKHGGSEVALPAATGSEGLETLTKLFDPQGTQDMPY